MVSQLQHEFLIPQAAIRLWGTAAAAAGESWAAGVSDDAKSFAASLTLPYCGVNSGFEAASWLDDPASVMSLALVPLRHGDTAFGMLVLGSPDPTRYSADMGTEFLLRIGEIAGAGLSRLTGVSTRRRTDAEALQAYLRHLAVERRLAARTLALYGEALRRLQAQAQEARRAVA